VGSKARGSADLLFKVCGLSFSSEGPNKRSTTEYMESTETIAMDFLCELCGLCGEFLRSLGQMRQRFLDFLFRILVIGEFAGEVLLVSGHIEVAVAA